VVLPGVEVVGVDVPDADVAEDCAVDVSAVAPVRDLVWLDVVDAPDVAAAEASPVKVLIVAPPRSAVGLVPGAVPVLAFELSPELLPELWLDIRVASLLVLPTWLTAVTVSHPVAVKAPQFGPPFMKKPQDPRGSWSGKAVARAEGIHIFDAP